MKRKIFLAVAALLIAIIICSLSNPSLNDFKEYIGETECNDFKLKFVKKKNYLVFSVFEFSYSVKPHGKECPGWQNRNYYDLRTGSFNGFFLNFYKR